MAPTSPRRKRRSFQYSIRDAAYTIPPAGAGLVWFLSILYIEMLELYRSEPAWRVVEAAFNTLLEMRRGSASRGIVVMWGPFNTLLEMPRGPRWT